MSVEQRMAALERANEIRAERSKLRARVMAGELSLADALEEPAARGMSVWQIIKWLPRWGENRVIMLAISLERAGVPIHYGKRVRSLTVRQRLALIDGVRTSPAGRACVKSAAASRAKVSKVARKTEFAAPAVDLFDVENAPPRCSECKIQMQGVSPSGLCGFCIEEREAAAA